jgi:hypothetical protein
MKRISLLAALALVAGLFVINVQPSNALTHNDPYCTGTHEGGTFNQVIVPSGEECILDGVTLLGGATAYPDSSLIVCNSTINGWLRGNRAYINVDNDTVIYGGVDIIPPAGTIEYEGVRESACGDNNECEYQECEYQTLTQSSSAGVLCPYKVGGPTNIHNGGPNSLTFDIGSCGHVYFKMGVNITYNNLPVYIQNSTIKGNLMCYYNNPPAMRNSVTVHGQSVGCVEQEMN